MKHFDDDMDELFNRAGRQYPLKTEPKNWDVVHGALHPEDGAASAAVNRNSFRRFLPLLLLLLIPAVYMMIEREDVNSDNSINNSETLASVESNDEVKENQTKEAQTKENQTKEVHTDLNDINQRIQPNQHPSNQTDKLKAADSKQTNTNQTDPKQPDANSTTLTQPKPNETNLSSTEPENAAQLNSIGSNSNRSKNIQSKNSQPINSAVTKPDYSQLTTRQPSTVASVKKEEKRVSLYNNLPPLSAEPASVTRPSESIDVNGKPGKLAGNNESASVPYIDKKKPSDKKGFYYGITAAPDASMIKGQDIKRAGYSAGIIAGYQVTRRWSFEAGVLWSRKKYFTDGKYFSKAGSQIPASVNVYWLDGGCSMLEFPLLVRYDFSPKKNTFFGSVGLTSYLMKNEDYVYGADAGTGYYEGYRSYDRSGDHLFSNLQLSAGYKFSLSPKMNMRIEPYLKAPLKKIGIGKMPITSAGLSFGLTRDFR